MVTMQEFQELAQKRDKAQDLWFMCWRVLRRENERLVRAGVVRCHESELKEEEDNARST